MFNAMAAELDGDIYQDQSRPSCYSLAYPLRHKCRVSTPVPIKVSSIFNAYTRHRIFDVQNADATCSVVVVVGGGIVGVGVIAGFATSGAVASVLRECPLSDLTN
ncbi:hypothetical protein BDR07DRAFT_831992 [Suillus spraguei]|nr:hypothetical protein BDR07DRAFT_831992 [Suillus spraguei]